MTPSSLRASLHAASLLSAMLSPVGLFAQEPAVAELVSGPAAGTALPACAVYAPSGPFAGTEFDASKHVGKAPAVLLFVHELTRNTMPMITGLDQLGVQLAWTGLETHTIRIAADRNEAEAAVKRSSEAVQLRRPILVSTDGAEGPGGYALNRKATLTFVFAKDGAVVRSVAFTDTGRADLPKLRALVEEVTGPIPTEPKALRAAMEERLTRDPAQLRALAIDLALLLQKVERSNEGRMQGQGGRAERRPNAAAGAQGAPTVPAKPREGNPPEDEELRALLRRAIQRPADATELDAVFAAVDKRAGDDAALRGQVADMWKLMISLDYGNDDSRARAKAWLEKHAPK